VAHYVHIKAGASKPWRVTFGRLNFVCTTCLIKDSVWTGTHIIHTVTAVFPYQCFRTKSFSLSNTERHPAVLLRHPDGWNVEQFEAFRHRGRSIWKVLVIRTDDDLTVECPNGISRLPNGCKGSDFFVLESVQNLLQV
jgi:hypothetical protein